LATFAASVSAVANSKGRPQEAETGGSALFDANPNYSWNRVYRCLMARTSSDGREYGEETLDPLLWWNTKHLLTGDSHRRALVCLDEFLRTHAERQVRDPIKRAICLRDLWAVFDWSADDKGNYESQRRELQIRLAEVLRRLAPEPKEIASLPDNYAEAVRQKVYAADYDPADPQRPFLPPDLFDPRGPWVCFTLRGYGPVATQHVVAFGARSRFLVFMRVPGARAETLSYLRKLWAFPERLMVDDSPNRSVPQFPAGTMVALVRQMNLFDKNGNLVATPVTESLQVRVYRSVTANPGVTNVHSGTVSRDQEFFEFRLDRRALFAGKPGLLAIGRAEEEFPVFSTQGEDAFETPPARQSHILQSCPACHGDSGIHSLRSKEQIVRMREHAAQDVVDDLHFGPIYWEAEETLSLKRSQYNWGLLNGYWKAMLTRLNSR
jgi:hypothetical protein